PFDPEALRARADLTAQRGERALAIRRLESAVDASPSDHKALSRLARLARWAGRNELGCRRSLAAAQVMGAEPKLAGEALACARDAGWSWAPAALLETLAPGLRGAAETFSRRHRAGEEGLIGYFRVHASWQGGHDLDVVLLDPHGH